MSKVDGAYLLCLKASCFPVSEKAGYLGEKHFTPRDGGEMPSLLHLRPYSPSFFIYSLYNTFKNRVDKVEKKYREISDGGYVRECVRGTSTLSTPFFPIRPEVQIRNGYTDTLKQSRDRSLYFVIYSVFFSTLFDTQMNTQNIGGKLRITMTRHANQRLCQAQMQTPTTATGRTRKTSPEQARRLRLKTQSENWEDDKC